MKSNSACFCQRKAAKEEAERAVREMKAPNCANSLLRIFAVIMLR